MRKAVLFIAMSLDGYIADADGGVDWLCGQESDIETEDRWSEFVKEVDTVLMGWNTYHQIVTELSPQAWVYGALTSYVFTHHKQPSAEQIHFVQEAPCSLLRRLKKQEGRDIWICGGANVVGQLLQEDLLDRFYISIIPTILGSGVRLFGALNREIPLTLTGTGSYNGITEVIYERRAVGTLPSTEGESECLQR